MKKILITLFLMAGFSCLSVNAQKTLMKPVKKPHKTRTVTSPRKPVRQHRHTERMQTEITPNSTQNTPVDSSTFQPILTDTINGHEYVDLGLSVKWATCNVGATKPSDYGDYFAWGETSTKSEYTSANSVTYNKSIDNFFGDSHYDAASANWGGTWRMPTVAEIDELKDNCKYEWTTIDGHNGYLVIGPNGTSIFLPAAGWRFGSSLYRVDESGRYWSSTPDEGDTQDAYNLYFGCDLFSRFWSYRNFGHPVRPVSE